MVVFQVVFVSHHQGQAKEQWAVSVVVITSALHAEGRQFEPGTAQFLCFPMVVLSFWDTYPKCQVGRVV